jgi:EGF domain-specific O-GlcNAc transferase
LREWTPQDVVHGTPRPEDCPEYWAGTGPRRVLAEYLRMGRNMAVQLARAARPRDFTILVKREENITNFWHALMEIMSLSMMLDTLRMSRNPKTDLPFYSNRDVENTHVVILDNREEGSWYDLWRLFSPNPVVRMSSVEAAATIPKLGNIIVPLPGPSNPMWEGD